MSKSQVDGAALLIAVAAAALSLMLLSSGQLDWLSSICGLALFLIVLGYDREGYRSVFESMGFAATVAICLTVAATIILRVFAGSLAQPAPIAGRIGSEWMPAIWLFVTVIFFLIDRARMGGRIPQGAIQTNSFAPKVFVPAPPPVMPVPAPAPAPPAAPVQEAPRPVVREAPAVTPTPATGPRPAFTQPTFSQPVPEPVRTPAAVPVSQASPVTASEPAYVPPQHAAYASAPQANTPPPQQPTHAAPPPPPPPEPATPSPRVPPAAPGREAMIYVNLVGEGLNVLRAVQAENLGRDYYRIVEPMPENETWQFGPGQVVRCKKRNLSSGKAMVAFEEAQRSS